MHTMYLLGAGASVGADVPMAVDMTRRIERLLEARGWKDALKTYRFVLGGLTLQKAIDGASPYDGLNVEEVYSALELLSQRDRLEASPFVASWHPTVDQLDRKAQAYLYEQMASAIRRDVHGLLGRTIPEVSGTLNGRFNTWKAGESLRGPTPRVDNLLRDIGDEVEGTIRTYLQDWSKGLGAELTRTPSAVTDAFSEAIAAATAPGTGMAFHDTCEAVLSLLSELLWVSDSSRVSYLAPLLESAQNDPVTIATLNYDNCIEKTCSSLDIQVDIGLDSWNRDGIFTFDVGDVHLLKLHGSINWRTSQENGPHGLVKESVWESPIDDDGFSGYRPVIVFGQREKLRAGGPFLDLLTAFKQRLADSRSLVVIGYSFRDAHINDCIARWLCMGERNLTIVSPTVPEGELARQLLSPRGPSPVRHVAKGIEEALCDGDLPLA